MIEAVYCDIPQCREVALLWSSQSNSSIFWSVSRSEYRAGLKGPCLVLVVE